MTLVPVIALVIGTPAFANGEVAVFGLHTGFAMLFVAGRLGVAVSESGARETLP